MDGYYVFCNITREVQRTFKTASGSYSTAVIKINQIILHEKNYYFFFKCSRAIHSDTSVVQLS